MGLVGEVQMAGDEVVDVVSVGHRLMPAAGSMAMAGHMPTKAMV